MNQILNQPKKIYIKYLYTITLFLSIIIIFVSFFRMFFLEYQKNKQIQISNSISKSYSISKLYANTIIIDNDIYKQTTPYIMGIIEVPKLGLNLPVISEMDDDLLKISVCRFYGPKKISTR